MRGMSLDSFALCEMCKKPINNSVLCNKCNNTRKAAQEYALLEEATSEQISEKFGISEKLIKKWVRKGEFWCFAPCRSCGKIVKGGNICIECRTRFANELRR